MKLTAKQTKTIDILETKNNKNIVLYGGSLGSGKSFLGTYWCLKVCLKYPGARALIGRNTRADLMKTTFLTFKKVCAIQGIVEGVHFVHNYQDNFTKFKNGSLIFWEPLDYRPRDPEFQRLGSFELTIAFIDEAGEIARKAATVLFTRIRHMLINGEPKMLMTCNPSKNFLYSDYYEPWKKGKLDNNKIFIPALPTDNYSADDPYIVGLMQELRGPERERLLFGNWDYDQNPDCIFDRDAMHDMFSNLIFDSVGKKYISCDVAGFGRDKAVVFYWSGLDAREIWISEKCGQDEIATVINDLKLRYSVGNSNIVIDADGIGTGLTDISFKGCKKFNNGSSPLIMSDKGDKDDVAEKDSNYIFGNLKAQCYYKFAELCSNRAVSIKVDNIHYFGENTEEIYGSDVKDVILQELDYARRKNAYKDGKKYMWSKDDIKKELGRSPDFAEALMMRFYYEIKGKPSVLDAIKNMRKNNG